MSTVEDLALPVDAEALARSLILQSDGLDKMVKARKALEPPKIVATDTPGQVNVYQVRKWALERVMLENPPEIRPGGPGPQSFVLTMPDGRAVVSKQVRPPDGELIRPADWPEYERRERQAKLDREDEILIANYGRKHCREAGILSWQLPDAATA